MTSAVVESAFHHELRSMDRREATFRPKRYHVLREELLARRRQQQTTDENKQQQQEEVKEDVNKQQQEQEEENSEDVESVDKKHETTTSSIQEDKLTSAEKEYMEWRKLLLQQKKKSFTSNNHLSASEMLHMMELKLRPSRSISNTKLSSFGEDTYSADTESEFGSATTSTAFTSLEDRRNKLSSAYGFVGLHQSFTRGDPWTTRITRVQFANNDSGVLAFASSDGCITVANANTTTDKGIVCELIGHTDAVFDIAWSLDNSILLSVSKDQTIRAWDLSDLTKPKCLRTIEDQSVPTCVIFHPFNNNVFVVGYGTQKKKVISLHRSPESDSAVVIYNLSTGKPLTLINSALKKTHTSLCKIGGSADSKIGKLGAIGGGNSGVTSMCFSIHADMLFVGDEKGFVTVLEMDEVNFHIKKKALAYKKVSETGMRVTSLSYSAYTSSSKQPIPCLLINATDDNVHLYKVTSPKSFQFSLIRSFPILHRKEHIRSCFTPLISYRHGACFVSGSESNEVYVFDLTKTSDHQSVQQLVGHIAPVVDVAWNYDETYLASADISGIVCVWKRSAGEDYGESQSKIERNETEATQQSEEDEDVDDDEIPSISESEPVSEQFETPSSSDADINTKFSE